MNIFGDVPAEHRELALELESLEGYYNDNLDRLPVEQVAKGYTCMAHDWIQIGLEERGLKLLERAEEHLPGYFSNHLLPQAAEDPDFNRLVVQLAAELVLLRISGL